MEKYEHDPAEALRVVVWGLGMVYAGLAFCVLALLVPFLFFYVIGHKGMWEEATTQPFKVSSWAVPLYVAIMLGLLVLGTLLAVGGELLCLRVPAEAQARGFAGVALLFQLLGAGPAVASLFIDFPEELANYVQYAGLLGFLFFLFFLRRLAEYLDNPSLAGRPLVILIALVVTGLLTGAAVAVARLFPDFELPEVPYLREPLPLYVPVLVLGGLVVLVLYARLLANAREAVADRVWELTAE